MNGRLVASGEYDIVASIIIIIIIISSSSSSKRGKDPRSIEVGCIIIIIQRQNRYGRKGHGQKRLED